MALPSQDDILRALGAIDIPETGQNVARDGLVASLSVRENPLPFVQIVLEIDPSLGEGIERLRAQIERRVKGVTGIGDVRVLMTAHKAAPHQNAASSAGRQAEPPRLPLGVKSVIAVASAKGGVGKSTTAVNLALAFHALGLSVGILDADVHGPSLPRLMGLRKEMEEDEDGLLIPHKALGIAALSIGLLVPEEAPIVWRAPMVHSALRQMLHGAEWGARDVLILDMPPGTGDVALSIAQHVPLTGAVIVSTPQDLALQDVRKGIEMFNKMNVPVLGMIENMSAFECPHCRAVTPVFGHGGARRDAERLNIPFLGHIPLDMAIRETSDAGTPIVHADPSGAHASLYKEMAETLRERLTPPDVLS